MESPPSRAAWIETLLRATLYHVVCCRRPRGRRGLKPFEVHHMDWNKGRRPRGRRGLKPNISRHSRYPIRRRPRGRRGLKPTSPSTWDRASRSPPSRAAWIETIAQSSQSEEWSRRRPRGRRGLKLSGIQWPNFPGRRRPRGRRGLKHDLLPVGVDLPMSPPSRAAWIETAASRPRRRTRFVAALAGGVD